MQIMLNLIQLGVIISLIYILFKTRMRLKSMPDKIPIETARQLEETSEELRKKVVELTSLLEVGKTITSALELDERLKIVAEKAVSIMKADVCSLRLLNEEKQELISKGSYGLSKDHIKKGPLKVGESIAGRVIKELRPIAVADLHEEKRMQHTDYIFRNGLCSLLSAPIVSGGEPIGVITVYTKTIHNFTEEEIALFSSFANYIATAIKNARLYDNLSENYIATIRALALAIEARDPYTRGHSERVTRYAIEIAKQMELADEDIETLHLAGKLHDIGKIAISDQILRKPAKLSVAEMAEIKLHPVKGAEMLASLEFLKTTIPSIKHHHERFDGNGYPEGLKGRKIPQLARILSVADAFDAMTSARPYRSPLSEEEAIEQIRKNIGEQFDPVVAEAFLEMLDKKK